MTDNIGVFGLGVMGANLVQAKRVFFSAHTCKRKDMEGIFHTNWQE